MYRFWKQMINLISFPHDSIYSQFQKINIGCQQMAIQTKISAWLLINQIKNAACIWTLTFSFSAQIMLLLFLQVRAGLLQECHIRAGEWPRGKGEENVCLKQSSKKIASLLHRLSHSLINKIIKENEWTWKCYFYTYLFQGVKVLFFFRNQEDWR